MRGKPGKNSLLEAKWRRHFREKVINCVKSDQVQQCVRTEYQIIHVVLLCDLTGLVLWKFKGELWNGCKRGKGGRGKCKQLNDMIQSFSFLFLLFFLFKSCDNDNGKVEVTFKSVLPTSRPSEVRKEQNYHSWEGYRKISSQNDWVSSRAKRRKDLARRIFSYWIYLIFTKILWNKLYYYSCFQMKKLKF